VSRRFFAAVTASSFDPPPPPKTFANFVIYKGKSAMQVTPLAPTFEQLGGTAQTTARDGGLLLTFAPASGPKAYDWGQARWRVAQLYAQATDSAATFSRRNRSKCSPLVSQSWASLWLPTATAKLRGLWTSTTTPGRAVRAKGRRPRSSRCALLDANAAPPFHPPSHGSATQVSPLDKKAVMFNLLVTTKGQEAHRMSVPVTSAELEVLCSIARFVIPRALGFDKVMM
jgi:hypothetical protein